MMYIFKPLFFLFAITTCFCTWYIIRGKGGGFFKAIGSWIVIALFKVAGFMSEDDNLFNFFFCFKIWHFHLTTFAYRRMLKKNLLHCQPYTEFLFFNFSLVYFFWQKNEPMNCVKNLSKLPRKNLFFIIFSFLSFSTQFIQVCKTGLFWSVNY